jgi:hypothetical protein
MLRRTDSRKSGTDNDYIVSLFVIHFVSDYFTLKLLCSGNEIIPSSFPDIRNYFLVRRGGCVK